MLCEALYVNLGYHRWMCSTSPCTSWGSGRHCGSQSPQTGSMCPARICPRQLPWTHRSDRRRLENDLDAGTGPCTAGPGGESDRREKHMKDDEVSTYMNILENIHKTFLPHCLCPHLSPQADISQVWCRRRQCTGKVFRQGCPFHNNPGPLILKYALHQSLLQPTGRGRWRRCTFVSKIAD